MTGHRHKWAFPQADGYREIGGNLNFRFWRGRKFLIDLFFKVLAPTARWLYPTANPKHWNPKLKSRTLAYSKNAENGVHRSPVEWSLEQRPEYRTKNCYRNLDKVERACVLSLSDALLWPFSVHMLLRTLLSRWTSAGYSRGSLWLLQSGTFHQWISVW